MNENRALIVEDSRTAGALLAKVLKKYSIESDLLNSSTEAFNYLKKTRPCVIFMDQTLPGQSGIETVRQLKASPFTRTIPVFMYTSHHGENFLQEALAAGAEGILPKKLEVKKVESLLQQLNLIPSQPSTLPFSTTRPPAPRTDDQPATATRAVAKRQQTVEVSLTDLEKLLDDRFTEFSSQVMMPFFSEIMEATQSTYSDDRYNSLNQLIDAKFTEFRKTALQPYLSKTLSSELQKLEQRERARQTYYISEIKGYIDSLLESKTRSPLEKIPDSFDEPSLSKKPAGNGIKYKSSGAMMGLVFFALVLVSAYQLY